MKSQLNRYARLSQLADGVGSNPIISEFESRIAHFLHTEVIAVMYENGKQINHYANKMIHKKKMKQGFLHGPYRWQHTTWEDFTAHLGPYDTTDYWKTCYLSGVRAYAAYKCKRKIRADFRRDAVKKYYSQMYAPQHGEYKKIADYWWIIY